MLKIEAKYSPISWLPYTNIVKCNVPQNWGDVTQKQLIAIACLYKSGISDTNFLKTMSGLKRKILNKLSDFEHYKLMEIYEFIGDQKPHHEFIIRQLKLRWMWSLSLSKWSKLEVKLYAPEGKLKGISFGQFIFADTYFANYQQSNDETDLNKFIACLYLKPGEMFEEFLIAHRSILISHVDKNVKGAIVLNYQLMHEWLALAYPLIFHTVNQITAPDASVTELVEVVEVKRDPNIWIKVFQNFVGDDIIHDEAWAAKPINTIFAYMTRKYKENARTKY